MFRFQRIAAAAALFSLQGGVCAAESSFAPDAAPSPDAVADAASTDAAAPEPALSELAAAAAASDEDVETVLVSGKRGKLSADQPQTSAGVAAGDLQERVFVNTEDALKNLPSLNMRKRYIGDRNGLMSGRSFNTVQAPRGVVYADGVLLSNFLGRFNAPRWNMVAPEEISRVDVLYGPYSALYPGNSIGSTVLVTTRDPATLTASGRAQYFTQSYSEYGYKDDYGGHQLSAFGGNRWGNWTCTLGVNQLKSESHPMQYATGTLLTNPSQAQQDAAVNVTGAILDHDPSGADRLILGPNGGSIEDTVQNQIKGKLAYENEWLHADAQLGYWTNDYEREGVSFLRDAAGNTVTRGTIRFADRVYTVADSSFGPQDGKEEHLFTALTARTRKDSGWNYSGVFSLYDIGRDVLRSSVPTGSGASANLNAGTITDGASGKGWWNLDLQTRYEREGLPHALTFGYYRSRYALDQERYATSDWSRGGREALVEDTEGVTLIQALYAQDVWRFAEDWSATAGLRFERWEAMDGLRANANVPDGLRYTDRKEEDFSPKLSIVYAPAAYTLRYSVGRSVRYPTVAELFQGNIGTTTVGGQPVATIINNDPNLKPEDALSQELAWEKTFAGKHHTRVSLFRDAIKDTIYSQTNVNVTPNVTNIQNVDEVVTQGVEFVYAIRDLLPNFDLDANLTLMRSEIEKNDNNPGTEGKNWPNLPRVRANLVANWRFLPAWNANLAVLRTGKRYNQLDNSDEGGCRFFGCVSSFTTVDARVGYRFLERYELGIGITNLTDEKYYEFHPYPQRTVVAEIKAVY